MRCEMCREQLSAYIDHELNGTEVEAIENHLTTCTSCQEALEQLKQIQISLRDISTIAVPARFHEDLMKQIEVLSEEPTTCDTCNKMKKNKMTNTIKYASCVAAALCVMWLGMDTIDTLPPMDVTSVSDSNQSHYTSDTSSRPRPGMKSVGPSVESSVTTVYEEWVIKGEDLEVYYQTIIDLVVGKGHILESIPFTECTLIMHSIEDKESFKIELQQALEALEIKHSVADATTIKITFQGE